MTTPWKPQVGDQLGHYQLKELLAVGGMGLVFRGYDPSLDRPVAIKVLAPELATDTQFAQQFVAEARTLATLNHPNVVHVYNVGQEHGLPYFAMELVEGDNLDVLLRAVKQLNITEATQLIRQAVLGLQHAQQRGIIHGDIKPANLVVTHHGILKVTDFGLARPTHNKHSSEFGTPEYASPEAIEGRPSDHRSDIYALGATFYQLLAGRPPFTGGTPDTIMQQHLRNTASPVTKFNLKVPPSLSRLISKCLAKKPGARYEDYGALLTDLEKIIADLTAKRSAKPSSSSSHSLAIAVVVVLLLAVAVYYSMRQQSSPTPPQVKEQPPTNHIETNAVPPPPPRPIATEEDQAAAEKIAAELQQQAEPLIIAGKLLEAWAVYQQWPRHPIHTATRAHTFITGQQERITKLARESWNASRAQVEACRAAHKYSEAIALCDAVSQALSLAFPEIGSSVQRERTRTVDDQDAYQKQLAAAREAAAKAVAARLAELHAQTDKHIVSLQWEKAQQELQSAAATAEGPLQAGIREILQNEVVPLLALRQMILARTKAKPGPTLALTTRTGTIDGEVLATDDGRLALGHVLPHGVVSTPITWDEITPNSILRFYAACHDPSKHDELLAHAVLLTHFAMAGLARFDDARQRLQAAAQANPDRAAFVTATLGRLDEAEKQQQEQAAHRAAVLAREQKATQAWALVEAAVTGKDIEGASRQLSEFLDKHKDTDCARAHQRQVDQLQRAIAALPPVSPFVPVPFGPGDVVRKLVSTADREVEEFFDGARTLATSGYFRKLDIPACGLPDDGRTVVKVGEQRIPFRIRVDLNSDAIVLLGEGGGRIGHTLNVPAALNKRSHRQVAVLFAAAGGSTLLEMFPRYENDNIDDAVAHSFRVWNWLDQPATENKAVGLLFASATDRRRVTLGAQVFDLNPERKLRGLRFLVSDTEASRLGMRVAILGVSLLPVNP
jgi:serine/threonine protein kinase